MVACKGVVLCECEAGCEVLVEYKTGNSKHEGRCCAQFVGFAAARP